MFAGIPDRAFELMLFAAADPPLSEREGHRDEQERCVRAPVVALCRELEPEFPAAYVYRLHKAPIFWKRQMAVIPVERDVGYTLELSFDGLVISAGWWKARPGQVEEYRRAVHEASSGHLLSVILNELGELGWSLEGDSLKRVPRPYPPNHPRANLLRLRSLCARRDFGIPDWLQERQAIEHVRDALRETRPLVEWLARAIQISN